MGKKFKKENKEADCQIWRLGKIHYTAKGDLFSSPFVLLSSCRRSPEHEGNPGWLNTSLLLNTTPAVTVTNHLPKHFMLWYPIWTSKEKGKKQAFPTQYCSVKAILRTLQLPVNLAQREGQHPKASTQHASEASRAAIWSLTSKHSNRGSH